jgi:hypothetical protein
MDKKKLYIIIATISALIVILAVLAFFLFYTPVISNIFEKKTAEEKEATETEELDTTENEEEEKEEEAEKVDTDEAKEAEEEEEAATTEEEEEEEEKTAPTISIEVYEGPTYSAPDNICFYRVKATVTGNPSPSVTWSKDDSGGSWGTRKAQVNITSPDETYNLTATATNSEGTATDYIVISWGCPIPNNPPEISEITVMGTKQYIDRTCVVEVSASDPDGDSLTYNWTVTGGTIENTHVENINWTNWTTPSECGDYKVTVTVSDGKGGENSKSEDIYVHFYYDLLEKAPEADWYSYPGMEHGLWNVGLEDPRGFACYRTNITLENGNTYTKVLETHPKWVSSSYIEGKFSNIIEIPEGARFKAEVGFIQGATGTDGVEFEVIFYESFVGHPIAYAHSTYDGALDSLDCSLDSLTGKKGVIIMTVFASGSSGQDWAVWVNPRIEN